MAKQHEHKAQTWRLLAAALLLALVYSIGSTAMSWHTAENLTEKMKPACVGRFLIDLPAGMDFSYSHTFLAGFWVAAIPESSSAFGQRVAAREAEINAQANELGAKNMEQVTPVSVNGLAGKIFTFGRTSVKGLEDDKTVYYVNVALEGFVHAEGTTFTFVTEAIDPDQTRVLTQLIDRLHVVAPDEIPTAPGFCFGRGIFVDPVPIDWTEGVTLFAGFRAHPDLALAFSTRAGLGPDPNDPGLLARDARADSELPLTHKARLKKLRVGPRIISGIPGEEVLEQATELNFVQVYGFDWQVRGTKDDALVPDMHLELSTGHTLSAGARPVSSFLNEGALLQLWDKVSASIRVRPTKPAPLAGSKPAPAGPALGDSAAAGDVCPETGWWQCADGSAALGVAGGHRQFLRKGQRMPQAVLLPPKTIWDRLRGVQPTHERSSPTAWTLVDRRSQARVSTDVPLAPAGTPSGTPACFGADINGISAGVGSFGSTGMPCPAAGWWRCMASDAMDGTRWFARGDVLPAATFRLAPRRISIPRGTAEVFQRRTTWQLVRQATAPDTGDG